MDPTRLLWTLQVAALMSVTVASSGLAEPIQNNLHSISAWNSQGLGSTDGQLDSLPHRMLLAAVAPLRKSPPPLHSPPPRRSPPPLHSPPLPRPPPLPRSPPPHVRLKTPPVGSPPLPRFPPPKVAPKTPLVGSPPLPRSPPPNLRPKTPPVGSPPLPRSPPPKSAPRTPPVGSPPLPRSPPPRAAPRTPPVGSPPLPRSPPPKVAPKPPPPKASRPPPTIILNPRPTKDAAGCKDLDTYCGEWKAGGYCTGGWLSGNPPQPIDTYWCPYTCGVCTAPNPPPSPPSPPTESYQLSLLTLVNQGRAANGRGPLCLTAKLNLAAAVHSESMVQDNYFSHTGSDGSRPSERVTAAGYVWTSTGENIASGQTTVQIVYDAWRNSPGHWANILGDYSHMGIYRVNNVWTQTFGGSSAEKCI